MPHIYNDRYNHNFAPPTKNLGAASFATYLATCVWQNRYALEGENTSACVECGRGRRGLRGGGVGYGGRGHGGGGQAGRNGAFLDGPNMAEQRQVNVNVCLSIYIPLYLQHH